jgi:hypothetical protein
MKGVLKETRSIVLSAADLAALEENGPRGVGNQAARGDNRL